MDKDFEIAALRANLRNTIAALNEANQRVETPPKKQRTRTQYSVVSKREGCNLKRKTFASLKRAQDRFGLLTSPEPWRFYGDESERERAGTDYQCCAGTRYDECACGGQTLIEYTAEARKNLPTLVWVRIEQRTISTTPWTPTSEPILPGSN